MTFINDYEESIALGIEHNSSYMTADWDAIVNNSLVHLKNGTGVRSACLSALQDRSKVKAILAYFQTGSIYELKQWAYSAAKVEIMRIHLEPGGNLESLFWALLSDNPEIIAWWRQHRLFGERPRKPEDAEDLKTDVYLRRQASRALNGEWDLLAPACELALASPEAFSKVKPRIAQFRFFLALAKGDVESMRDVLMEMCAPKARRRSFEYESGYTAYFVVMFATLFAKMAWWHGYELRLETPWIPEDWLPTRPNDSYTDPWAVMADFDIWANFPAPFLDFSPKLP